MHLLRITALDKVGRVAVAAEKLIQFLMTDAGQHARVGDLVPVQVQDREHHTVGEGIEKLVGVPGGRQRAGFRLTVADHTGHDQVGIVVGSPVRVRNGVTQFASFVNGSRSLGCHVAGDAAREMRIG